MAIQVCAWHDMFLGGRSKQKLKPGKHALAELLLHLHWGFPRLSQRGPLRQPDQRNSLLSNMQVTFVSFLQLCQALSDQGTHSFALAQRFSFPSWSLTKHYLPRNPLLFAKHFQTKEPLPEEQYQRLRAARTFRAATMMLRQDPLCSRDAVAGGPFKHMCTSTRTAVVNLRCRRKYGGRLHLMHDAHARGTHERRK
eukprot:1158513-Pelagomonas_calceolata.AAC.3